MSNQTLPISNVISVTIQSAPTLPGIPNINTLALISQESPSGWAPGQVFAIYTDISQVATDWGVNSSAFAIAEAFFAQQPNPLATGGYLVIIPRLQSPSLETAQACITRVLNKVAFFGVVIDEEMDSQATVFHNLANYIQTLDKVFFYASSNIADLLPNSILDVVRQSVDVNTRCLYYGNPLLNGASVQQTQIFAAAYAARALSTDFGGSNTTQTMHLKQLAGITPDQTLTQTALAEAQAAGVDIYPSIASFACLFTSGANSFWDQVYNQFWLKFALQTAGFDLLAGTSTKIPQTEQGMNQLKNVLAAVLQQGVNNGFLAPGAWNSPTVFGNTQDLIRNIKDLGWYIFSSPIASQSAADRAARKAPLIQIAAKSAGAVHSVNIVVQISL